MSIIVLFMSCAICSQCSRFIPAVVFGRRKIGTREQKWIKRRRSILLPFSDTAISSDILGEVK